MLAQKIKGTYSRSIPLREACFHPHSFADDAGRLFSWEGQLLRGIGHEYAQLLSRLFDAGVVQSLVERGLLIETEPTDLTLDGYAMVVKHQRLPFVSYPNEWCAAMLKDAALTIIDLTTELTKRRLTLKDAHPWNVLFNATKPVYVDLTSIVAQADESGWQAYDEFCRFCYYPLILMSHGQERIARSLLPEYDGVLRKELLTLTCGSLPSRFTLSRLLGRGLRSIQSVFTNESGGNQPALAFLMRARRNLEKIRFPSNHSGRPKRCDESFSTLPSQFDWTPQQRVLHGILDELQPGSVLDLSRGAAWPSTLSASLGHSVVSISGNSARATEIYEIARAENLPILPLIIDFIKPTPSIGYSSHYSIAATERLKCDMVLALGLVHRVVFERYLNFDLIAEGLSSFSKRWLVVEFAQRETEAESEGRASQFPWYTLDNFIGALRRRFSDVRVLPGAAEPRTLLCEK